MINDAFEYEIWQQEQARKRSEPLRWDNDNPEWYQQVAQEAFWSEDENAE